MTSGQAMGEPSGNAERDVEWEASLSTKKVDARDDMIFAGLEVDHVVIKCSPLNH